MKLRAADVIAARSCERCDVDRCCSRPYKGLRSGAGGSAGGKDVIHEDDLLAADGGRIGDLEDTAHVLTALTRRKSSLAFCRAQTYERGRRKRQAPRRMRFAQSLDCASGKHASLVESALPAPAAMKWDRNDEQFAWNFAAELFHGRGEHNAEPPGRGSHAIVLECMDRVAHASVVGAKGNGAHKGRRREAAGAAEIR
jgi:hypothetical protein